MYPLIYKFWQIFTLNNCKGRALFLQYYNGQLLAMTTLLLIFNEVMSKYVQCTLGLNQGPKLTYYNREPLWAQ